MTFGIMKALEQPFGVDSLENKIVYQVLNRSVCYFQFYPCMQEEGGMGSVATCMFSICFNNDDCLIDVYILHFFGVSLCHVVQQIRYAHLIFI